MGKRELKHSKEHNQYRRDICNRYEKTKKGFVMRMYRNMKSRVEGVQKLKAHLYEGLELMGKEEFYDFTLNSPVFNNLFEKYVESGYDIKLSPTPDREDSSKGYLKENIKFKTHSENSIKALKKPVKVNGVDYEGVVDASLALGVPTTALNYYLNSGIKTRNKYGIYEAEKLRG